MARHVLSPWTGGPRSPAHARGVLLAPGWAPLPPGPCPGPGPGPGAPCPRLALPPLRAAAHVRAEGWGAKSLSWVSVRERAVMHSLTCSRMSEELRGGQEGIFPGCERRCTTGGSGREGVVPLSKPPHLDGAAQLGSPLQRGREELGGQEGSRSGPLLPAQRSLAEAFPAQRAAPCWGLGLALRPAPRGAPSACWEPGVGQGNAAHGPASGGDQGRFSSRAGSRTQRSRLQRARDILLPSPAVPRTGQAATVSNTAAPAERGDRKSDGDPRGKSARLQLCCSRQAGGAVPAPCSWGRAGWGPPLPGRSPALGREGAEPSGRAWGSGAAGRAGTKELFAAALNGSLASDLFCLGAGIVLGQAASRQPLVCSKISGRGSRGGRGPGTRAALLSSCAAGLL